MLENGFITAEREAAKKAGTEDPRGAEVAAVHAEYVAETARQLIFAQYGDEAYTRGLNVFT
jgi:penicillin-binding protein 1A